ncbi:protein lin-52 homolog isoform X2 [Physeter macrocephalus]|uniref:Protein lin-52 homolog n=1 Tax=Physeter macrocephalus TaxID=9755 RepID=A0A9W2WZX1_PHYMC|nr:protein lin-52 homolog isoform X2 [Physeter catodon]
MASPTDGADLEASLLSFEKLDRASPDLWPEQLPGVAEFAASFKSPITSSPPKWMAEIERDDIDMLKELGSLTTANLMEKVRGLQNLAYQLGLDESCPSRSLGTKGMVSCFVMSKRRGERNNCSRIIWDFSGSTVVKNPPANAEDMGLIPGPGRSHMLRSS